MELTIQISGTREHFFLQMREHPEIHFQCLDFSQEKLALALRAMLLHWDASMARSGREYRRVVVNFTKGNQRIASLTWCPPRLKNRTT